MKNVELIRMEREKQNGNVVRCMRATWNAFVSLPIRYPGSIELIVIKIMAFFYSPVFRIHFTRYSRDVTSHDNVWQELGQHTI